MQGKVVLLFLLGATVGYCESTTDQKANGHGTQTRTGFPSSKAFQKQRETLLMTSAFKAGLLPKDSALRAIPHAFTTFVSPLGGEEITLRQFLGQYREKPDLYLDQGIIDTFKALLPLPKALECSFFTSNFLSSRIIWRYAEETAQLDFGTLNQNTLYCVTDGTGSVRLSAKQLKEEALSVKPGDCLYLPPEQQASWDLQGRVIIVALTWSGSHPSSEKCEKGSKEEKVLANFNFKEDSSPDIFGMLSLNTLSTFFEDYHLTHNCTQDTFNKRFQKKYLKKLVEWNDECQAVADELFEQMDIKKDGILSLEDLEDLKPKEIRHLAGLLADRVADMTDIAGDQEDDKPKKRGPVGVAEGFKADYEKELHAILEEGFNEILLEANIPGKVSFDKDGKAQVQRTAEDTSDKEGKSPVKSPTEKEPDNNEKKEAKRKSEKPSDNNEKKEAKRKTEKAHEKPKNSSPPKEEL